MSPGRGTLAIEAGELRGNRVLNRGYLHSVTPAGSHNLSAGAHSRAPCLAICCQRTLAEPDDTPLPSYAVNHNAADQCSASENRQVPPATDGWSAPMAYRYCPVIPASRLGAIRVWPRHPRNPKIDRNGHILAPVTLHCVPNRPSPLSFDYSI